MEVAGAIGNEYDRVVGERVRRVVEVEDAPERGRVVVRTGGLLVRRTCARARRGVVTHPATLEEEHHLLRRGVTHPEAELAADGASAVTAGDHLLPHRRRDWLGGSTGLEIRRRRARDKDGTQ